MLPLHNSLFTFFSYFTKLELFSEDTTIFIHKRSFTLLTDKIFVPKGENFILLQHIYQLRNLDETVDGEHIFSKDDDLLTSVIKHLLYANIN